MGNEMSKEIDAYDDELNILMRDAEKRKKELEQMLVVSKTVSNCVHMAAYGESSETLFDLQKFDSLNSQQQQQVKSDFFQKFNKDTTLRKKLTADIEGFKGVETVGKFAFKAKTFNIDLERLGMVQMSPDDSNTLAHYVKKGDITVQSLSANWVTQGRIDAVVTVRNNTNKQISFCMESGTVFEGPANEQSVVASESGNFIIEAGETLTKTINGLCMNSDLSGPSGGSFKPTLLNLFIVKQDIENCQRKLKQYVDKAKKAQMLSELQTSVWNKIRNNIAKYEKFVQKMES